MALNNPNEANSSGVSAPALLQVTEYYHGRTLRLSPANWHGAKACAIVTPTTAYCFDNATQLNAFTTTPAANPAPGSVTPDGEQVPLGVDCSGYTKIWNGASWTGTGLAFKDWGYPQNLNSYVPTPFKVLSWFSDGQRGYSSNNCSARIFTGFNATGSNLYLPPRAHALNLGNAYSTDSIELYPPA